MCCGLHYNISDKVTVRQNERAIFSDPRLLRRVAKGRKGSQKVIKGVSALAASRKKSEDVSTESVLGFEEALKSLESLVLAIERGDMSLDESLLAYQKGVGLARLCQERLAVAEQQVKVLEADLLRPFELDQSQTGQTGQTDD